MVQKKVNGKEKYEEKKKVRKNTSITIGIQLKIERKNR
jgi:hypothetical protein